jgi:hypothetical protein
VKITAKVLGLENDDLSNASKFLPTMIKFGVPTPEASWAMMAGVPFRELAIKFAVGYKAKHHKSDLRSFQEWIGTLDSDRLKLEYGLRPPILDDVGNALQRVGINPLLRQIKQVKGMFPIETIVKGIPFDERRIAAKKASVGNHITLRRHYMNKFDRNAISVFLDDKDIGYIDRDLAQVLAPEIDAGLTILGSISDVQLAEIPQIKVNLTLNG